MGPGLYKFVDESGAHMGNVSVNSSGTWQWSPRFGGATSQGKWATSVIRVTNFIADNGLEVCRRQAQGACNYDSTAPWRGGDLVSIGILSK